MDSNIFGRVSRELMDHPKLRRFFSIHDEFDCYTGDGKKTKYIDRILDHVKPGDTLHLVKDGQFWTAHAAGMGNDAENAAGMGNDAENAAGESNEEEFHDAVEDEIATGNLAI